MPYKHFRRLSYERDKTNRKTFKRTSYKLYALMYREKFDLENPSEEEKWIICQYRIILIIDKAFREVIRKNEKSSKKNGK